MGALNPPAKSKGKIKLSTGARKVRLLNNISGYFFIGPWLLGFIAFSIIPIGASIFYSFTHYDILDSPVLHGIVNFEKMLTDELFWKALGVTFHYAFVSVPLRLLFAFCVAMLFNRKARGGKLYQMIYYIPSIVGGSIAVAVMWRRMFMSEGAINSILQVFGVNSNVSWIGRPDTAIWTLIILAAWQFGSSMLIFLAGLKQIPKVYYEAAEIDGASSYTKFIHITIPHLTPVIFFNLVMQLINGFTVFTQAFVVSGGNGDPLNSTLVYTLYLYHRAFKYNQMGYASAMAWVLVMIIGIFTAVIFKTSSAWVYYESKDVK